MMHYVIQQQSEPFSLNKKPLEPQLKLLASQELQITQNLWSTILLT